jgi:hypothetical protein
VTAPLLALCLLALQTADENATLDTMVSMNRSALAALEAGKAEAARDELLEAIVLGKQKGLATHQMTARSYLHLGAVYLAGLKDPTKARRQLILALRIRPDMQITPQLDSPELRALFEEAKAEATEPEAPPPPPPVEPAAVATVEAPPPPRTRRFWVAVSAGSGIGAHPPRTLEFRDDFSRSTGLAAAALFQLAPEVGYWIREGVGVSMQYRLQLVPHSGSTEDRADGREGAAHAVLIRGQKRLRDVGPAQLWGTAAVGVGSAFRLRVSAGRELPGSDTVDGGPIALGPGAALLYPLGDRLSLTAEARALLGLWRAALLAELSVGAAYGF